MKVMVRAQWVVLCLLAALPAADAKTPKRAPPETILTATPVPPVPLSARPQLVVDPASGRVVFAQEARTPWYPASLTKLMTAYVTFQAMKAGRVRSDTPVFISLNANQQKPSKMGFIPGSAVTLDAALYMMLVKSANDMAVAIAETVAGNQTAFANEMNVWSQRLGMSDSVWRNPNGLPDPGQMTSARDLALLSQALLREFPHYQGYLRSPGFQLGERVYRNYNPLLGRFDGADGMKTGYICSSGFNLVASATRHGQRYIAVVLGENSSRGRAERAALLLEKAFMGGGGFFAGGALTNLPRSASADQLPVDMKSYVCGKGRKGGSEADDIDAEIAAMAPVRDGGLFSAFDTRYAQDSAAAQGTSAAAGPHPSLLGPKPQIIAGVTLVAELGDAKKKIPARVAVLGQELPALPAPAAPAPSLAKPLVPVIAAPYATRPVVVKPASPSTPPRAAAKPPAPLVPVLPSGPQSLTAAKPTAGTSNASPSLVQRAWDRAKPEKDKAVRVSGKPVPLTASRKETKTMSAPPAKPGGTSSSKKAADSKTAEQLLEWVRKNDGAR